MSFAECVGRRSRRRPRWCQSGRGALIISSLLVFSAALGDVRARAADEWPKQVVLHPAAAPEPVLKYQLLPGMYERHPGNAAVLYGRIKAERSGFFTNEGIWKTIYDAQHAPLDQVGQMEGIRMPHDRGIFRDLERAGQCEECDWQYPVSVDGYATLLPDAQEKREFARLLVADCRWRIAHRDFEGAVRSLRVGFAMARHTADSPLMVPALVGMGTTDVLSDCTLELIQQPGAPNLYWALSYLPVPLFDSRQIFEGEMRLIDATFPQLTTTDRDIDDPAYWQRQIEQAAELYLYDLCYDETDRAEFKREFAIRLLRAYPVAKRATIDSGWSEEEVEAMPVGKVILLHARQVYARLRDEALVYLLLPYWEASPRIEQFDKRLHTSASQWQFVVPIGGMFSSLETIRRALAGQQRDIAVLRLFEAIRLHGAANQGRLPATLGDLTVPLPIDPMTGKPFQYSVREGAARIESPALPGYRCEYEIRFAAGDK